MTTQLRFGSTDETLLHASDEEFLAAVHWRGSASGICRDLGKTPDLRAIGLCWKQQCPTVSAENLNLPAPALRFSSIDKWVEQAESDSLGKALRAVRRAKSRVSKAVVQKLDQWLDANSLQCSAPTTRSERQTKRNSQMIESDVDALLATCELLILHGHRLPAELLGRLWRTALAGAMSQAESFEQAMKTEDWQDRLAESDSRTDWLKGGLLPWTCGLLFDEVKGAPRLAKGAKASLNFQMLHSTDGDGVPAADLLRNVRVGVAGWADALLIGELFERPVWKSSAETRCSRFLTRVATTLRPDGGTTGSTASATDLAGICHTLGRLSGTDFRKRWARLIEQTATEVRPGTEAPKSVRKKDIPSWQSDDAEAACLRTSWSPNASSVTLTHDEDPVSIEMLVAGTPLLRGDWGIELEEDGEGVEFEAAWECVCFYTDQDVDYCELQFEFEGGPTIDRYVMVSRTREFAVLADVLVGSPAKRVDLTTFLPLEEGVKLQAVTGSREQYLKSGRQRVRVMPLALPYDAGTGTPGRVELTEEDGQSYLAVTHASETGGLFAPVLFDWSKARRNAFAEWRQLTVTHAGDVDTSGAFGYRVRVGDQHLVLFRSLESTDRYRTVLGYQPENETVIADFTKKGELSEILLVE